MGLIGFGGFGRFIADIFANMPEVQIVSVADVDRVRVDEAARMFGGKIYDNPEELLKDPTVQVVVISSPPASHGNLIVEAANNGKHIFCEKPIATTLADADSAIEAARKNNVRLTVDFVLRHNPLNDQIISLVRSGLLGRLHHMSLENWATDEVLKPGHWFWDFDQSGGIWIEHGVHFFDLFSAMSGQTADLVESFAYTRPDGCQDRVWAMVSYPDGLKATFHHAFTQPARFEQTTIRLASVRGYITLSGWIQTKAVIEGLVNDQEYKQICSILNTEPVKIEQYTGPDCIGWAGGEPYNITKRVHFEIELKQGKQAVYRESVASAMKDFIQAVKDSRRQPLVSAKEARIALATAIAAKNATERGLRVKVTNPKEDEK